MRSARGRAKDVRRLMLCSGKVAVDLLTSPLRAAVAGVAVCRVEQLYPLPVRDMLARSSGYPALEEVVVGAGRAGEHGRVGVRAARRSKALAGSRRAVGARAAAQLEPGGRIRGAARAESGRAADARR